MIFFPLSSGYFNPRSREGSDSVVVHTAFCFPRFQSTLPRRERQVCNICSPAPIPFQSTLPRRERPDGKADYDFSDLISIHAPAKGATCRLVILFIMPYNFNPRSREGSDSSTSHQTIHFNPFQSTLPRRERLYGSIIHGHCDINAFQSTLPRRERLSGLIGLLHLSIFQSTLPRRERQRLVRILSTEDLFQSTLPRRERRGSHAVYGFFYSGFQSTLPRRERRIFCFSPLIYCIFQSMLPRRERHYREICKLIGDRFQSTLPRRERPVTLFALANSYKFQSTLPRRERHQKSHISFQILIFI